MEFGEVVDFERFDLEIAVGRATLTGFWDGDV